MSLSSEFFRKIAKRLFLPRKRLDAIASIDPTHVYVENVRAVFGISNGLARRLCELGVKEGFFERRVQVLCPDNVVAAEAETEELLPHEVHCWREIDGDFEEVTYETDGLQKMEFYIYRQEGVA
jgi:hypothetical protein